MDEQALFQDVLQGNADAIAFMNDIALVSQVWDDLIDRDTECSDLIINRAMMCLLSSIPRNPFYQSNITELQPVIESAMIDWLTANKFESRQDTLPLAWILRDNLASLLITCAKVIGGMNWAIQASEMIRLHVHNESLETYIHERRQHTES